MGKRSQGLSCPEGRGRGMGTAVFLGQPAWEAGVPGGPCALGSGVAHAGWLPGS